MGMILKGSAGVSQLILCRDAVGAPVTGLVYNSAGLVASYARTRATRQPIALVAVAIAAAWTAGGFCEVDAANEPGLYRLDAPDAAYATGADVVVLSLTGANVSHAAKEIDLVSINVQDAVRMGLTSLPNAVLNAIGGFKSDVQEAGTAQGGAAGSITLRAGASAATDAYKSMLVKIISGTGAGQRPVFSTAYNGTTKVLAVSPNFGTPPDNTSVYAVCDFGVDLPTDTQIAGAVWNELWSAHTVAGSFGEAMQPIRRGTAQGGAANAIQLDAGASSIDNFYKDTLVRIIAGTGAPQARYLSGYNGTTKTGTPQGNWLVAPDNTSVFVVLNGASIPGASAPTAADVADAVWDEATTGHLIAGSYGQLFAPLRAALAQGGGGSTITLDAAASALDQFYKYALLRITAGTGAGQSRSIVDYVGLTKVATVDRAWQINPDNSSVFLLINQAPGSLTYLGREELVMHDLGAPTAVPSVFNIKSIVGYLGAKAIFPIWETSTQQTLFRADGVTAISTSSQFDDGTTYKKGLDT